MLNLGKVIRLIFFRIKGLSGAEIGLRGSRNHHCKTDQASLIKVLFSVFGCFRKKQFLLFCKSFLQHLTNLMKSLPLHFLHTLLLRVANEVWYHWIEAPILSVLVMDDFFTQRDLNLYTSIQCKKGTKTSRSFYCLKFLSSLSLFRYFYSHKLKKKSSWNKWDIPVQFGQENMRNPVKH